MKDSIKFLNIKSEKTGSLGMIFLCLIIVTIIFYFILNTIISRPHFNFPIESDYRVKLQLFKDGKLVSLNDTSTIGDYCSQSLAAQPINLEKDRTQTVHIRWEGITGGELLKYYGINSIGGIKSVLGFRLDNLPNTITVRANEEIATNIDNSNLYIYSGSFNNFKLLNNQDFLYEDLELSLKKSDLRIERDRNRAKSIFDNIFVSGQKLENDPLQPKFTEGEVNAINKIIGNLIVYVQQNPPTSQEVGKAFSNLEILTPINCS